MRKRTVVNLSSFKPTTMNMGWLVPINIVETLPGDTIRGSSSVFVRLNNMIVPPMHPVYVHIWHVYVPYYLLWDDFSDFITGGDDGLDTTGHPYVNCGTVTEGTLKDYLGLSSFAGTEQVNALPLEAYHYIYNELFDDRDFPITPAHTINTHINGLRNDTVLRNALWQKDYFTTARNYESLGNDVTVPLTADGSQIGVTSGSAATSVLTADATGKIQSGITSDTIHGRGQMSGYVVDVDDLRLAIAKDRFQHRAARHGGDYYEYLRALGIRGDDQRLGRPVILGGGRNVIQFSEVLATGTEAGVTELGEMAGHGVSAMRTPRYLRFFREHGIIMTLMTVRPMPLYTTATERFWYRTTKEDYFQPEYAKIGDQVVTNKEIDAGHASPDDTFGYQERYSEYRRALSVVSGEYNSTLDHWHFARQWASDPTLNWNFLVCGPTERPFADTGPHTCRVMVMNNVTARRMLPRDGRVPKTGI